MKLQKLVIAAFALSATAAFANVHTIGAQADAATVKQVQQALNDKGFDAGPADGIAGPKTQAALQKFQQSQGVAASGSIDVQTLASLGVSGSTNGSSEASATSSFSPRNDQAAAQASPPSMSSSATATPNPNAAAPSDVNALTSTPTNPASDQSTGAASSAGTNQPISK